MSRLQSLGGLGSITNVSFSWPSASQIFETLTLQAGFNTTTVIIGATLLGCAGGLIGTFALLRKRSLMADGLSHATLPGIAIAFIVAAKMGLEGRSLGLLLFGAAMTGVLGVLCIHWIVRWTRLREDAAIGIVLSTFFGVGVVLLSVIQSMSVGNQGGLGTFIYGQTAAMSRFDALLMGSIAVLSIVASWALHKEFAVVCFNSAYAQVTGWPVQLLDLVMMALIVLVTVAGLQAVGLILVVALLIVPAAAARFWTQRLSRLLVIACVIGGMSGYLGSAISALFPRQPTGSVIVLTSGVIFGISFFLAPARGVLFDGARRLRLNLHIASDHILEALYEEELDGAGFLDIDALVRSRGGGRAKVATLIWYLRKRGDVVRERHGLRLTAQGRRIGARISRNHRLWEQYLISYADIAASHVDWSVDQVEHVLSESLVRELDAALRSRGIRVPMAAGAEAGA